MARGLLAEGRAAEVARMLEPLVDAAAEPATDDAGAWLVRALLARVRVLRDGRPERALALLEAVRERGRHHALPAPACAEVALSLGWAHAWPGGPGPHGARALGLFREALQSFERVFDASGQYWAYLGQALAYAVLDEVALLCDALDHAHERVRVLDDAHAALWYHDVSARAGLASGAYAAAQRHAEALHDRANRYDDPLAHGRAHAYQAAILYNRGRPPAAIIEEAILAEHRLEQAGATTGHAFRTALQARVGAHIRRGHLEEAENLLQRQTTLGAGRLDAHVTALILQARIEVQRGRFEASRAVAEQAFEAAHGQRPLLAAEAARILAEGLRREQAFEDAQAWAERAHRLASAVGGRAAQLRALLLQALSAVDAGDTDAARRMLGAADAFSDLLAVLPLAADHLFVRGRLAYHRGDAEEARGCLAQALRAYQRIGDADAIARVRQVFATVGAAADADAALTGLGARLARVAASAELVAKGWLEAVMTACPPEADGDWAGVFHHDAAGMWACLAATGPLPDPLPDPPPADTEAPVDDVRWVRMGDASRWFTAVRRGGQTLDAWARAQEQLAPWWPVAALALERALLHTQQDGPARTPDPEDVSPPIEGLIVAGDATRRLVERVRRLSVSRCPVLVAGERGTGKGLIARAVHAASGRSEGPFITVNCAAVPRGLFEDHLFGHAPETFEGAPGAQPGALRSAAGGTLFLDEVGDLPPEVQPQLLRFLQDGAITPLGADYPTAVDVRVVAATTRDLSALVADGLFDADLLDHLSMVALRVPPLRERRAEIPVLVRHFLATLKPARTPTPTVTPHALDALLQYGWPGNVRQLRNEMERALAYVSAEPAPCLDRPLLSTPIREAALAADAAPPADHVLLLNRDLDAVLADTERALIERVLAEYDGQVSAAADRLGLTRQGLYKKIKRLGIDVARLQHAPPPPDRALSLN